MRRASRRATTAACALAVACLPPLAACGGASRGAPPAGAAAARDTLSAACAAADTLAETAAIAMEAAVRAREVRFREAPRTGARVSGSAGLSCTERTNLPHPVRAGETYRDVEVRWRLRATLDTARVPSPAPDSAAPPGAGGRPGSR